MATNCAAFYFVILTYLFTYSYGSLITYQGNKFIIGFATQHMAFSTNGTNRIYLTSNTNATVRLRAPAISLDTNIKLIPGIPRHIDLPGKARMNSITGIEKKGIELTSSDDFAVYGMNLLTKSSDGFLGLPVSALGTDYVIATAIPVLKSFLFIVATENATIVKVKLKIAALGFVSYQNRKYYDGDTIVVTLSALEGFQIITKSMEDATGSRVTSDKPVSVYSGCDCTYVPVNKPSCDYLVEQILPVKLLGKHFVTMATANRTGGDLYHVIAAHNDTIVTIDNKVVTTIHDGQWYELDSKSTENHVILTSKPSLVIQYGKGYSVDNSIFDPYMSTVPAISQYTNDYTIFIPTHLSKNYFITFINIAVKTKELNNIQITKDGNIQLTFKSSECSSIASAQYSVCSKQLTKGFYRIYHQLFTETFALMMYGTWHRESFGFPVGLTFKDPGCKQSHMIPEDGIDNDCDGRIDEEISNNKDDDGDGRIDEDLATKPPTLILPPNVTNVICAGWSNFDSKEFGQATGVSSGKCKILGPLKISHNDYLELHDKCNKTRKRTWEVTDACANNVKGIQYIHFRFVVKPMIKFPDDFTTTCRGKSELSTTITGKVNIINGKCNRHITTSYQDSMFFPCSVAERTLERNWIVKDECGRNTTHTQLIRLLPLDNNKKTRNFNASIILTSKAMRKHETINQSEARVLKQVDKAIMFSPIAKSYIGSSILQFRSILSKPVANLLVKFQSSSQLMVDDLLSNLHIALFTGVLADIVNSTEDITVQDFNECISSDYNDCGENAACHNNVGSYNCTCLQGFVGDGWKCHGLPSITYITLYTEAGIGENVTIRCDVQGLPEPKVSWKTSKGRILDKDVGLRDIKTLDDGTKMVRVKEQQQDNSLVISDVRADDSGLYTCMVKNSLGETQKVANLTVRKDRIAVQASVTLVEESFTDELKNRESLRFRTLESQLITELAPLFKNVSGYQKVEIVQFVEGSVKAFFRVVAKGDESRDTRQSTQHQVGKLLKKEVSSGYLGQFKVKKSAELRGRPPAPANLQSSDIKSTSVKLTWEPPSLHTMYGVSMYSVQYKEFGSHINTWRTASVTSLAHTVTKLKPGASYLMRAKSKNEYGASEPSSLLEITTLKAEAKASTAGRSKTEWLVLILIPILALIILIFVIVCIVRIIRRKKGKYTTTATEEIGMVPLDTPQRRQPRQSWRPFRSKKFTLTHEGTNEDHYATTGPTNIKKTKRISEVEGKLLLEPGDQHSWQEISRDQLTLGVILGEGQFGKVYEGTVTDSSGKEMTCAVKMLKSTATETDLKDLLNELEIMASVGHHNNVIDLIGVCASGGPLLAVVEYAENGNLLHYLRLHRRQNYDNMADYTVDISDANRLKFACEISKGMSHLARMKCIHRDLAARIVLLGESLVAKVSDFGLSRDVYTDNVYDKKTGGKLPARWMALESLEHGLYSSQSDVWSFGVVLWEIETGGSTPFASYIVPEMIEHFKAGRRLGRPTGCNRNLYGIMLRCWNSNPDRRPTFDTLTHELKQLYQEETMYVNIGDKEDSNANQNQPSTSPQDC